MNVIVVFLNQLPFIIHEVEQHSPLSRFMNSEDTLVELPITTLMII